MSCETGQNKTTGAATATGISRRASKSGYQVGQGQSLAPYLPGSDQKPLPWPPPGRRSPWYDYRAQIKVALKAWRSQRDDRALGRLRVELAGELAERVIAAQGKDHPAGMAGGLAEERAGLLLSPPKSITVGERVERVAILDNALALLRLKRAINESQYRAALVDTVCRRRAAPKRSTAPVSWLPGRPAGAETEVASQVDPARKIKARYRVVELEEPVASNTLAGEINPAYEQALQPRRRRRAASRVQIDSIARKLEAGVLLRPEASWSDGPPLVGPDGMVESGNGRILALRRAAELYPAGYESYRRQLLKQANRFGLTRVEIDKIKRPALVRERLTPMDAEQRQRFVAEANAAGVARMGVAEQARADAQLIPPGFFSDLQVAGSDASLARVLAKKANAPVVSRFFKLLPETEQAALMDGQGNLSADGINRLERAMFAYAMPGASGERLASLVFEAGEAIDRVGAGLRWALPKLGQMEDTIRSGQRRRELSLGDDLSTTVEKMRDIRRQGLGVNDYLRQYKMFPELTPVQEQLLAQLDERRRSGRRVAELINAYAGQVKKTASPQQGRMFGQFTASREGLLRSALKEVSGTWVDLSKWSAAQRAISGFDLPAPQVQRLTPAQQVRGMRRAGSTPASLA